MSTAQVYLEKRSLMAQTPQKSEKAGSDYQPKSKNGDGIREEKINESAKRMFFLFGLFFLVLGIGVLFIRLRGSR